MRRRGTAATVCAVALAASLGAAVIPVRAWAQTPAGSQAEARRQFQAGAVHYQAQRYPEAIEAFRTAYHLLPTPVILFNLAQAYRGDGRLSEAVATFRQFVTESQHLTPTQRQDVETAIAEIESQRAVLSFEVEPAGATLVLDGREIGTLPLSRAVELLPGEHSLSLRLERHEPRTDTITLRPHDQRLYTFTLRPTARSARVVVSTVPEDAEITVDGAEAGAGHATRDMDPGDHVVIVRRDGYATYTRTVHLATMARETLLVTLDRAHRPILQSPWFWVGIGAVVVLAGTSAWLVTHPPGTPPIQGNTPPYVVQSVTSW